MEKKIILAIVAVFVCILVIINAGSNPEKNLMDSLEAYNKANNCYYNVTMNFKFMDLNDMSQRIEEYKKDGNYYSKYYKYHTMPTLVNVAGDETKYSENPYLAVSGSTQESKDEKGLFWLNKIKPEDILKNSVKKIKKPDSVNAECKMYSAKYKNVTDLEICVNKENFPVYMKFKNLDYFTDLFDIVQLDSVTRGKGEVVVELSDIRNNASVNPSFEIKPKGINMTVQELKASMQSQRSNFQKMNKSLGELKDMSKDLQKMYDDGDYEPVDYSPAAVQKRNAERQKMFDEAMKD